MNTTQSCIKVRCHYNFHSRSTLSFFSCVTIRAGVSCKPASLWTRNSLPHKLNTTLTLGNSGESPSLLVDTNYFSGDGSPFTPRRSIVVNCPRGFHLRQRRISSQDKTSFPNALPRKRMSILLCAIGHKPFVLHPTCFFPQRSCHTSRSSALSPAVSDSGR